MKRWFVLLILPVLAACAWAQAPVPGPNVNMVSGTDWTVGDPFLQRQNEPSIAVSTRNASHLLAGDNDYRSVDFEELFGEQISGEPTPDAWLGVFKSFDGGATWASTLLPGFPADTSTAGQSSPLFHLAAAADPIVRAGTNGMFYYAGIAFNRNSNIGKVFLARFIDNNNKENGNPTNTVGQLTNVSPTDPIRYLGTLALQSGGSSQFLDKPWLAVDVPRGSSTCSISYTNPDGSTGTQTIPASNVYVSFTDFVTQQNNTTQSSILFMRSTNCGATWSTPIALSGLGVNQGSVIAVAPPIPGTESSYPPIVYVAWRQFGSGNTPSAIMMAVSINGGASFFSAFAAHTFPLSCNTTPTGTGCPFDQGITSTAFRTNAYPTLAADTTGRTYLAWSQRQANGDARIMLQVGLLGVSPPPQFSTPVVIDNGSVHDDNGNPFTNLSGRGHQIMPAITFNAGKLTLIYYDLRQDHTIGQFTQSGNTGYGETRFFEGELSSNDNAAASVFNFWIDDSGAPPSHPLTIRRHTIDVQGAQGTPLAPLNLSAPTFTSFRIAHYQFGINPYDSSNAVQQLEVSPPNLPMFQQGTVPFMGDYIDVAGALPFVMSSGKWHFNTDSTHGLPVFHAAWTDNRNVQPPPPGGSWANYTPPFSTSNPGGGKSVFDPTKTVLTCNPGFVAMRNQDIYTSRIAPGLVVQVPGNQKTLGTVPNSSTLLQRAFSVVVQNTTASQLTFRLTIANQPLLANGSADPKGQATFQQLPLTNGASPLVTTLDVQVAALSSVSRMVFVKSQNPTASVTVNVQQITGVGGTVVSGGLTSTTAINPDPTTPPIINPDENPAVSNPAVSNAEVYNPAVSNPAVSNPAVSNPAVSNVTVLNPAVSNPAVSNPAVSNPAVSNQAVSAAINPAVSNATISNPAVSNPAVSNPAVSNQSVSDASYTLTNTGNTVATYSIQLFGSNPSGLPLQLILNKLYYLNEAGGANGCTLQQQPTNVILSNIQSPTLVTNPSQLGNPAVSNPAVSNATVAVPPGETVQVTLRIGPGANQPALTPQQVQNMVLNYITPVVVSHAVNTQNLGQTNPQPPINLTITTTALPNANLNVAYSQQVAAIGGVINPPTTNYTWTLFSGSLPLGLSISSSGTGSTHKVGLISGTPTAGGTYNFVVQVADAATPTANIAKQALSITVVAPLAANTAPLAAGTQNQPYTGQLTATGGTPPYTWSINPPNPLPGVGLALNPSTGQITGTPNTTTTVNFTATVKDSSTPQQSSSQVLSIQVVSPLVFTLPPTQTATAGTPFSENLSTTYTSGGLAPYTYTVASGSTAPFTLSGSTISGTATGAGSAVFSIKVTDSANNSQTLPQTITIVNPVVISSIQPSTTVAAGYGQMITLFTSGIPSGDPVAATFTQVANTANTQSGFVFISGNNVYYVRLPIGFPNGATNVVVTDTSTGVSSPSFPITVSTTPAAPVENFIYGLSTAPAPANNNCGLGLSSSPATTVTAGQGIVAFAYGTDTLGPTVVFSDGTHTIPVSPTCSAYSSPSLGIGSVVTVPAGLNVGPITVKIETTVNSVTSALSNGISLTLGSPHLSWVQQPATTGNAFQTMPAVQVTAFDQNNNPVSGVPVTLAINSTGLNGCSTPSSATYAISAITTGGQVTVTTAASVWPYLYASISGTGTSLDSPQLVRIASVQDSEHFTLATGGPAASTGSITVYYTSYPLANISNTGGGTLVSATVQSFTANIAPALLIGQWVMISNASPPSFNTTAPVQVVNAGLLEGGYTINYNQSGTSGTATVPGMITIVQLGGTLTQTTGAGGIATFPDLQINTGGTGYTLGASATGYGPATSNSFTQYGYCATAGNMLFPHYFNGASDASAILGASLVGGGTPNFTGGEDFTGSVTPNFERLCTADDVRTRGARIGQFCAPTDFATLMTAARTNHIAVTLQGGPMFIAGGFGTGGSTALATAEIIDSEVSYTPVSAQMITPRANAAAILLRDGRVLIAGGGNNGNGDNTAELFDPTTNTFYPTANNMAQSRGRFAVPLLLNSGRVLIVGGTSSSGQVDIFDPTTDSFIANPPSLKQPRNMMAAALLPNGKVLVAGGAGTIVNPGCGDPGPTGSLQSAELYDPVANSFSCAGMMLLPVQEFSALTLPNGTVLLPSGRNESAAPADLTTATSELYNPQTQQFSSTAPLRDGRYLYDSFLLNGAGNATPLGEQNDALVAGGTAQDGGTSLLSAELYNAPDQLVSGTATVTSISVFPASATVPVGRSYQFTGVATLSDLSTRFVPVPATWASSNTGLATAATNGVITPLAGSAGQSVNVTVNFGSVTSPPAVLHISGSALSFSPPGTQSANQGVPFSEDLSTYTSGGTPPYTYSIVSGSTSPFTLSGSVISGTASSTGSATFTVRVFDSAANTLTAAQTINITNPLSITNIIPSTAAAGFGQMVTIFTTGVPNPSQATATFTNGGSPQGGFVFLGASSPNELWVRIPSGFPTGATNVVVTNTSTSDSSAPFPITVSTTPGTPQTYAVYGESAAPGGSGGACGSGPTGSPINSVVAGQGIVVYGYGIDTAGSNVVFYDGSHAALTVTPACSFSSATGIGLVVTVPFGYLNNGPIQIGLQTQVNGTSPLSAIGYYPSTFTLTSWQVNINSIPDTPTTAGQGFPISAQLLDNNNNPVSGVAVTASVSSNFCPSGALEGTVTMQTDTNGNVSYTDTNITLGGNDYVLTVAPPFAPSAGDQDSLVTNVGFCPTLNNMSDSRDLHTSVLVSSGSPPQASDSGPILVAGGIDNSGVVSNTADLYNAATNKFTASSHTMVSARAGHTATALGNNKVLLAGGYADASSGLGTNTGTAEIYNATTDTFTATTGEMVHPRQGHTATLLSNGMVLIAGGIADTDGYNGSINIPAELYDPSTGLFTAIGNPMVNVRTGHTATLLPDGTVLIAGGAVPIPAGGGGYTLSYTNTAEIFTLNTGTPANSTFTATTNNMSSARYGQIAVFTPPINSGLLSPPFPNQVLLAGGTASNLNTDDQTSADLYDPTSKTFTPTGSMATARWGHVGVAQFNGSVMVAGGDSVNVTQLSSAELFKPTFGSNPPTGTFQPQPSMSVPRINATATGNFSNLSNPDNPFTGIILVTGGFGNGVTQNTGEVYYGGSGLATF